MKLEDLVKEGFTEEQAKKILDLHKKAIDGNYVPKDTFNAERRWMTLLRTTLRRTLSIRLS